MATISGTGSSLGRKNFQTVCLDPQSKKRSPPLLLENDFNHSIIGGVLFQRPLRYRCDYSSVRHLWVKSHVDGDRLGVTLDAHFLHTAPCS